MPSVDRIAVELEELDLIRLVTQLPVSEIGDRLLHLQAGSKLGLYLLELSNLPLDALTVEEAEEDLARPLYWLLTQLRSRGSSLPMAEFLELLAAASADELIRGRLQQPNRARLLEGMKVFFTLAVKTGLITLDSDRVLLSLMGQRHIRHPQPMLPLIAHALREGDQEGALLRLIVGGMVLAFPDRDWAPAGLPYQVATDLLAEMGHQAKPDDIRDIMQTFGALCYAANCESLLDDTALVLLQYLVSEVLQPE